MLKEKAKENKIGNVCLFIYLSIESSPIIPLPWLDPWSRLRIIIIITI